MGIYYGGGGYAPPPSGYAGPPKQVNWNWINESFQLFVNAAPVWIAGVVLYGIAQAVFGAILNAGFSNPAYVPTVNPFDPSSYLYAYDVLTPLGNILCVLGSLAFNGFQSACFYRVAVKQVRGRQPEFADLFNPGGMFWDMVLYIILFGVALAAGFCAFCVGMNVAYGLFLPGFAMVADGEDASRAVSRSIGAMKGDWLSASAFILVFGFVTCAGLIVTCCLGVFVAVPMFYLISALAYRDMAGMPMPQQSGGINYGVSQAGVWPPPPSNGGGASGSNSGEPPYGGPPPPASA